jgi:hypothetical protein
MTPTEGRLTFSSTKRSARRLNRRWVRRPRLISPIRIRAQVQREARRYGRCEAASEGERRLAFNAGKRLSSILIIGSLTLHAGPATRHSPRCYDAIAIILDEPNLLLVALGAIFEGFPALLNVLPGAFHRVACAQH